jgi:peptidoglycan/xylan/chitin deacetylase (PgdA/CDA1 family)
MLHRCSPINSENLYWNEHMKVSPEFLENFLYERNKTHEFITLDMLSELVETGKILKKPFIVMTFDDGYRDNYEYALPIFEKMRIPFTVYVTNSFPDKTAFLWWYVLEDILQQNNCIKLSDGEWGSEFSLTSKTEKEEVFLQLRSIILGLNQEKLIEGFAELFHDYTVDVASYNERLCLSWDMIKEMASSSYCTIAAHTINHKTLKLLSDIELEYEIVQGKKALEEKIGKPVNHFAYPFGTYNEVGKREINFVKMNGFDTACCSFGEDVNKKNMINLCELPRVFLGELYH